MFISSCIASSELFILREAIPADSILVIAKPYGQASVFRLCSMRVIVLKKDRREYEQKHYYILFYHLPLT